MGLEIPTGRSICYELTLSGPMSGQMVNELHMGALGSGIASASRNALLMAVSSLYIRLAVPQLRGVQEQRGALSAGNGAGSGTRCSCPQLPLNWRGFGSSRQGRSNRRSRLHACACCG